MRNYLMGLLVLALCCAVVELLSPAGEGNGIGKHVKLMSALCLLCVLTQPLTQLLREGATLPERLQGWVDGISPGDGESDEQYAERWEEECERLDVSLAAETVAELLETEFGLAAADCRVELILSESNTISKVRVALSGQAIWVNTHEMETYIERMLGCPSMIYIE